MAKRVAISVVGLVVLSCLAVCASVSAAVVVVGSPLSGEFGSTVSISGLNSLIASTSVGEEGAHATSPVSGTVVRWRTKGTFSGGGFRPMVLSPAAGGYRGTAAGSFQTPVGGSLQSFATDLPIQAGDLVGLEAETKTAGYSFGGSPAGSWTIFSPPTTEGSPFTPIANNASEVGFDVEVVPTPAVIVIGPASGPLAGGTAVTIAGRDLEGATAVKFGSGAASADITVVSDNQITAIAPPAATAGPVAITVTTAGGTSLPVPGGQFTYTAPSQPPTNQQTTSQPSTSQSPSPQTNGQIPTCTVPDLIGNRLGKATKKLSSTGCTLGTVKKANGITKKTGRVTKQHPKPGGTVPRGTKVSVTLG